MRKDPALDGGVLPHLVLKTWTDSGIGCRGIVRRGGGFHIFVGETLVTAVPATRLIVSFCFFRLWSVDFEDIL